MSYGAKGGHGYGNNSKRSHGGFRVSEAARSKALHQYGDKPTLANLKRLNKTNYNFHLERGNTALAEEYGFLSSPEGIARIKADRINADDSYPAHEIYDPLTGRYALAHTAKVTDDDFIVRNERSQRLKHAHGIMSTVRFFNSQDTEDYIKNRLQNNMNKGYVCWRDE